ncbi:MAG: glutathione S-transferase [Limnobacter sp.]|nr:glutathione S-transferase [Limnobacter sp.]
MAEFTLYCFAQSGNAYKAALMLNLCGADWSPRFVDFFNGETRTPAYRALNVMGEVPLLEHGAQRLSQSGVILDYLSTHFGRFGGKDDAQRREVLRWLLFDNHKLTSYIATLRYMLQFAKTGETPVTEWLRSRMGPALSVLDSQLGARPFVAGDEATIADVSLCGYLFWPDEFGVDWADWPDIARWLGRISALPGWVHPYALMPGHPLPGRGEPSSPSPTR